VTVHITWPGVLMAVGVVSLLWMLARVLYALWAVFWWDE
jgi:hypothetical protein